MGPDLVLSKDDTPEQAMAKITAHMAEVEKERARQRADAEREAEQEREAERLLASSSKTRLEHGRQYSVHALAQLGKAGIEDIIAQAIESQVPSARRELASFNKYKRDLIASTTELVSLYANGSNSRPAINTAAGKVAYTAGLVGIRPPVRGVEHDIKEWQ